MPLRVRSLARPAKPLIRAALLAGGYYHWRRMRLSQRQAAILLYHHVGSPSDRLDGCWAPFQQGVSQARFDRQMRFLNRAMTPMTLREIADRIRVSKPLPPRAVAVTFDDGYLDNFTVAYPILKRYEIPATIFVSTGFIETGQAFWWDQVYSMLRDSRVPAVDLNCIGQRAKSEEERAGRKGQSAQRYKLRGRESRIRAAEAVIDLLCAVPGESRDRTLQRLASVLGFNSNVPVTGPPMMTWEHLREMSRNGIAIESHTHTHPILGLAHSGIIEEELSISKRLIEDRIGQVVHGLAYPDGRRGTYNNDVLRLAKQVGFTFGCVAEPGQVAPGSDVFSLRRMPVGNVFFTDFISNLLSAYAEASASAGKGFKSESV